jgi:hypothetical protein
MRTLAKDGLSVAAWVGKVASLIWSQLGFAG